MAQITEEIIDGLSNFQTSIWDTVSVTTSENVGQAVTFASPLTVSARVNDIQSEFSSQMLIIQFAMASHPENFQAVLISSDTILQLAKLATGVELDEIDENVISDVRPIAESIVQGLCIALGNVMIETIVATGLSIRYQGFQLPPNFARSLDIIRTQATVEGEGVTGSITWLIDGETANALLRITTEVESGGDATAPVFASAPAGGGQAAGGFAPPQTGGGHAPNAPHLPEVDAGSLEVLLDVPLEISVELGRVKMMVREVLDLGTGSIVEVDKAAGEPVDVMVNGRLVARGEVVVIEDNFGVRITEILNPNERFRLDGAA